MLIGQLNKVKVFIVVFFLILSYIPAKAGEYGAGTDKKPAGTGITEKKADKKTKKYKKGTPKDVSVNNEHALGADINALNAKVSNLINVTQTQQQVIAGQETEINRLKDTVSSLKNTLQSTTGDLSICRQEKEAWLNSDREAKTKLAQQISRAKEILKNLDVSGNAVKELTGSLTEGLETRQKQQIQGSETIKKNIEVVTAQDTEKFLSPAPVIPEISAEVKHEKTEKPEKPEKSDHGAAINNISVIFDEQSFMPLIKTLAVTAAKTKQMSISQQGDFIIAASALETDKCNVSVKVFRNEKVVKQFNINIEGC